MVEFVNPLIVYLALVGLRPKIDVALFLFRAPRCESYGKYPKRGLAAPWNINLVSFWLLIIRDFSLSQPKSLSILIFRVIIDAIVGMHRPTCYDCAPSWPVARDT